MSDFLIAKRFGQFEPVGLTIVGLHVAAEVRLKKIGCNEVSKDSSQSYLLARGLDDDARLARDFNYGASVDCNGIPQDGSQCALETIFSPGFHFSEGVSSVKSYKVDFSKCFNDKDHVSGLHQSGHKVLNCDVLDYQIPMERSNGVVEELAKHTSENRSLEDGNGPVCNSEMEEHEGNILSAKDSPLCLEIQCVKMDCDVDLHSESTNLQVYDEPDEDDEMADFDPYLFIKNLPELSTVVPTFRPMLLPKQTRSCPSTTLVLDLDETLVHSSLEHCDDADFSFPVHFNLKEHTVYVRCRPHLMLFMERVASLFEIIIFTASQSIYAEQLLNMLDPKRKIFRHRVYREACVFVDGNYLKDLTVLGRDLARVAIIDNSPQAFGFQVDNGIPIESWFDDRSDDALPSLLPFLESLVGVDDVRPLIAKKFNLREKVAGAVDPSHCINKGDPFDR
ncbi:CTD small phosphatase-like protein 2 [Nymphaea thermarum]|nr:CTD small phosphatase-like protein 2 [Nymphaea thermarum]